MSTKPEQVVCVNDKLKQGFDYKGLFPNADTPVEGEVYTIRGLSEKEGYLFVEIQTREVFLNGGEKGYDRDRFRPVKDTNIDLFLEMDKKVFNKKKLKVPS